MIEVRKAEPTFSSKRPGRSNGSRVSGRRSSSPPLCYLGHQSRSTGSHIQAWLVKLRCHHLAHAHEHRIASTSSKNQRFLASSHLKQFTNEASPSPHIFERAQTNHSDKACVGSVCNGPGKRVFLFRWSIT